MRSEVPDWPFPSVVYDYVQAGVGTCPPRVVEADKEEVERVLAFLQGERRRGDE